MVYNEQKSRTKVEEYKITDIRKKIRMYISADEMIPRKIVNTLPREKQQEIVYAYHAET